MMNRVLIVGSSAKFIAVVKELLPSANLTVTSWRNCNVRIATHTCPLRPFDLIVLCGYDYQSGHYTYSKYLEVNVNKPLALVSACATKNTRLIYVDTMAATKTYTFSRYLYAKNLFATQLVSMFPQTNILRIPTVVGMDKKIEVFGGRLTHKLFNLLIRLGLVQTISLEALKSQFKSTLETPAVQPAPKAIQPKTLGFRRTLLIDRMLRLFLG